SHKRSAPTTPPTRCRPTASSPTSGSCTSAGLRQVTFPQRWPRPTPARQGGSSPLRQRVGRNRQLGELAVQPLVAAHLDPRPHERVERPRQCHRDAKGDFPPV